MVSPHDSSSFSPLSPLPPLSSLFARPLIYKEEFYRIYYLPQLYANDDVVRAIRYLEMAEKAPLCPLPSKP